MKLTEAQRLEMIRKSWRISLLPNIAILTLILSIMAAFVIHRSV